VSAVKSALEQTPPELAADIAEKGMVLDRRRRAGWRHRPPAHGGNRPAGDHRRGRADSVVRGSGMALEKIERLASIFTND